MLSSTCFTDTPVTFAVMYGCTDDIMEDTELWMRRCNASVFHPLILPVIFAEHERKRLFNAKEELSTELAKRILELENRVRKGTSEKEQEPAKSQGKQSMTQRDCEAIDLWRSMSYLKNGLESLHTELGSMRDHLHLLPGSIAKHGTIATTPENIEGPEVHIDARLKEMMHECRSKIRSCEGLLGSMTLATQMVRLFFHCLLTF